MPVIFFQNVHNDYVKVNNYTINNTFIHVFYQ